MNKVKNTISEGLVRILITLLTSFLLCTALSSQTIIKGTIDPSLKIDSFRFYYSTNFLEHSEVYSRGYKNIVQVKNGEFSISLVGSTEVFYMEFVFPKNYSDTIGSDYKVLGNLGFTYMLQPNTELTIQVLPQKVVFSGNQKHLMECQMELGVLMGRMGNKRMNLTNAQILDESTSKEYVWQYLAANKELYDEEISEAHVIVSNYAKHVDNATRNAVYYNYLGIVRWTELNKLNFRVDFNKDTLRSYIVEYYNTFYSGDKCPDEAEGYLGQSNWYPKYLVYKVLTDIRMRLAPLGRGVKSNLLVAESLISDRYEGYLYDQVATSLLLNRGKNYMDELFFTTLLGNVKNEEYLAHIQEVRDKRLGGQEAYRFELEAENGKIYTNEDFKGKVVLLDFWFAGCRGCIALHKNMQPVKEYFKDNPNFVYVSISTDDDKALWKKSLAGGLYTDETDMKLWLGEIGRNHPIIKYYDINAYPTMILIDTKNKIVSMNPPNPYSERNKNTLINIVEESLNK